MNNNAKDILNNIQNHVGTFRNSKDILKIFKLFIGFFFVDIIFSILSGVSFYLLEDTNNIYTLFFPVSGILTLIMAILSFNYYLDLKTYINCNSKTFFLFSKLFLTSIFHKNKNTNNSLYINFMYNLFSLNTIKDNLMFIDNITPSRFEEVLEIQSAFFSYIYNNYKNFNKENLDRIIIIIQIGKISHTHKMFFGANEFNEFYFLLEEYQENREKRELAKKVTNF